MYTQYEFTLSAKMQKLLVEVLRHIIKTQLAPENTNHFKN